MSYNFNSIVSKSEVNELRAMILKRAQEKASEFEGFEQNDIMDMARNSFVSDNNPFSKIIENTNTPATEIQPKQTFKEEEPVSKQEPIEGLGFPMRRTNEDMQKRTIVMNEQVASMTIKNNMMEAREALSNKKSFMGALEFLNSQAAISLVKTRADKFEMIV